MAQGDVRCDIARFCLNAQLHCYTIVAMASTLIAKASNLMLFQFFFRNLPTFGGSELKCSRSTRAARRPHV